MTGSSRESVTSSAPDHDAAIPSVFVAEKGQLTAPSKTALRKAGIVVVEVEDLTKCEFMRAGEVVGANDLSWAALHALNVKGSYGSEGTGQRAQFVANLLKVIAENAGRA